MLPAAAGGGNEILCNSLPPPPARDDEDEGEDADPPKLLPPPAEESAGAGTCMPNVRGDGGMAVVDVAALRVVDSGVAPPIDAVIEGVAVMARWP